MTRLIGGKKTGNSISMQGRRISLAFAPEFPEDRSRRAC